MAKKDFLGGKKNSKKNNMKENRKRNPYSQKSARLKEQNLIRNCKEQKSFNGLEKPAVGTISVFQKDSSQKYK